MSLFSLHGRPPSAFPSGSLEPASTRVAEPDPPWEASPPDACGQPGDHLEDARRTYGNRLVDAAVRTLGLSTNPLTPVPPGAELNTRQALREASQALAGVDFLTQLEFSAACRGPGFKEVAQRVGLPLAELGPEVCERIDTRMGQRFAEAAASGSAPVDRRTAAQWLHHELFILTC